MVKTWNGYGIGVSERTSENLARVLATSLRHIWGCGVPRTTAKYSRTLAHPRHPSQERKLKLSPPPRESPDLDQSPTRRLASSQKITSSAVINASTSVPAAVNPPDDNPQYIHRAPACRKSTFPFDVTRRASPFGIQSRSPLETGDAKMQLRNIRCHIELRSWLRN